MLRLWLLKQEASLHMHVLLLLPPATVTLVAAAVTIVVLAATVAVVLDAAALLADDLRPVVSKPPCPGGEKGNIQ
jgi:hypothetical protein